MKSTIKQHKFPPLHEGCGKDELRENLTCIHIKNGIATTTDACILIRYDLSSFFQPNELEFLNDKLIPSSYWKIMASEPPYCTVVYEDRISVRKGKYNIVFTFNNTEGLRYPNIHPILNEVIDGSLREDKGCIRVASNKIAMVSKVINPSGFDAITFLFNAGNKGYCVYNHTNDNCVAIIMPVEMDEEIPSFDKLKTIELPLNG